MIHKLNKIHFKHKNIGHIPQLDKYVNHGFSWGKEAGNMQFSTGDKVEVRQRIINFLNSQNMGDIKSSINMIPEHSDRIIDIDDIDALKRHRFGISIHSDAVFTKLPDLTLTVKPADCTTAIIYTKNQDKEEIIGLVHSGRRGTGKELPKKAIQHLIKYYNANPRNIFVGIVPHLDKSNRKFENLNDFGNLEVWEGFIEKKDGYYYPDESGCALDQYSNVGIPDENIYEYTVNTFTSAENGETFSHKYHVEQERKGESTEDGGFMVAVRRR